MLDANPVDGVILATPNALHAEGALAAIARGVPVLIEKPLATSVEESMRIVAASEAAGIPVLVGHHRRHSAIIKAARDCVARGDLGRLTAVNGMCLFYKPDDYFDVEWRRSAQAGPILVNLVHDIDNLRFICGEIESVEAIACQQSRGFEAEDTAAVILRFANGALGAFTLSDAAVAPWSWELTSGENPDYPQRDASCYFISGDQGSLSLPGLELWTYEGRRGWNEPLQRSPIAIARTDPLAAQLEHFLSVIRRASKPMCDARDAMQTITVIEAIRASIQKISQT